MENIEVYNNAKIQFERIQKRIDDISDILEELQKDPVKNFTQIMFYNQKVQSLIEEQSNYLY